MLYAHVYLFKYLFGDLGLVINDDTHLFLKYSSLQQFNTTFLWQCHNLVLQVVQIWTYTLLYEFFTCLTWYAGITTLVGGGTGPAEGTRATTCTPAPLHMKLMLQSTDDMPLNFGFTGKVCRLFLLIFYFSANIDDFNVQNFERWRCWHPYIKKEKRWLTTSSCTLHFFGFNLGKQFYTWWTTWNSQSWGNGT